LTGREHTSSCSPDPLIIFQSLHKRRNSEITGNYFCRRYSQTLQINSSCQIRKPLHHAGTPNDPKKIPTKISCKQLCKWIV